MDPSNEPQPVKTTVHSAKGKDMPPLVADSEKGNFRKIIILTLILLLLAVCAVGGWYAALYIGILN